MRDVSWHSGPEGVFQSEIVLNKFLSSFYQPGSCKVPRSCYGQQPYLFGYLHFPMEIQAILLAVGLKSRHRLQRKSEINELDLGPAFSSAAAFDLNVQ